MTIRLIAYCLSGSSIKYEDIVHDATEHEQQPPMVFQALKIDAKVDMLVNDFYWYFGRIRKEMLLEMAKQRGVFWIVKKRAKSVANTTNNSIYKRDGLVFL